MEPLRATLVPARIGVSLIGVFGILALLLAAVGLYGVIAYWSASAPVSWEWARPWVPAAGIS